jgi:hypothetical protein
MFAATVFNIAATVICFAVLLFAYSFLIVPHIFEGSSAIGLPLLFAASVVISFFIYRRLFKQYFKR